MASSSCPCMRAYWLHRTCWWHRVGWLDKACRYEVNRRGIVKRNMFLWVWLFRCSRHFWWRCVIKACTICAVNISTVKPSRLLSTFCGVAAMHCGWSELGSVLYGMYAYGRGQVRPGAAMREGLLQCVLEDVMLRM